MWRRPVVTILLVLIAMILALPMRAQQKPVAPTGTRPDMVGRSTCADPSLRSGQARKVSATASAFRSVYAAVMLALPMRAQEKPFTQEQLSNMVRDGFGDESGARLIEQRGIDFVPVEHFVQSLKAAGASEAFLKALRAATPPEPASAKKPLNQVQVFALLAGQVSSHRVAMLVNERGIDFEPQQDYLDEVRLGGGDDELLAALKSAKVMKPATVDPAAQARQAEVRRHVARGAELKRKNQYAEAEQEYRAALLLDPRNADLYVSLAYLLSLQNKWDDAASAGREALRFDPNNGGAHNNLGVALEKKGDLRGALKQYRAAYMLDPKNATYKQNYGRLSQQVKK